MEFCRKDQIPQGIYMADLENDNNKMFTEIHVLKNENKHLQDILDSRPAINAALPESYINWSRKIYYVNVKSEVSDDMIQDLKNKFHTTYLNYDDMRFKQIATESKLNELTRATQEYFSAIRLYSKYACSDTANLVHEMQGNLERLINK